MKRDIASMSITSRNPFHEVGKIIDIASYMFSYDQPFLLTHKIIIIRFKAGKIRIYPVKLFFTLLFTKNAI